MHMHFISCHNLRHLRLTAFSPTMQSDIAHLLNFNPASVTNDSQELDPRKSLKMALKLTFWTRNLVVAGVRCFQLKTERHLEIEHAHPLGGCRLLLKHTRHLAVQSIIFKQGSKNFETLRPQAVNLFCINSLFSYLESDLKGSRLGTV